MRLVLTSLALTATVALMPAAAQQTGQVTYVDAGTVAAAMAAGGRLSAGPDFAASGARRTGPGQVEVHDKETDLIKVIKP